MHLIHSSDKKVKLLLTEIYSFLTQQARKCLACPFNLLMTYFLKFCHEEGMQTRVVQGGGIKEKSCKK